MANQLEIRNCIFEALDHGATTEQILSWVADGFSEYDDTIPGPDDDVADRLRELAEEYTSDD